jgi:hypothetical protein
MRPIDPEKHDLAKELLAEGRLSRRQIGALLGICRTTVCRIESGKCKRKAAANGDAAVDNVGPPVRCMGCGGMVSLPCILCRVRAAMKSARRRTATAGSDPVLLSFNLRPEHEARRQEVRRRREAIDQSVDGELLGRGA